jgi:hypothetical protein
MRRYLVPVVLACALASCRDQAPESPNVQSARGFAVVQGGNGHFYFLPPMVKNPNPTGVFNPRLNPVVEICGLSPSGQCTSPLVASFNRQGGTRGEQVVVEGEIYQVDWNTRKYELANGYYRIRVLSAPSSGAHTELGRIDVLLARTGNDAKNATGGAIGIVNGSTLPIKFRIEESALCATEDQDCFEGVVDSEGGTFTLPNLTAGAEIPQNAISQGTEVTLIIERVRDKSEACLPMDFPQYEGCYRFRTEPDLAQFNLPVTVGLCLEEAAEDIVDQLELWKWDEVDPASLERVETANAPFIQCDGFTLSALNTARWKGLASAGGRALRSFAQLMRATPAYAANVDDDLRGPVPFGGTLGDFSRMGVVQRLELEIAAGDGQSATAGSALPNPVTVKVTSAVTGDPVTGVPITFQVQTGGGSVTPDAATTGSDGQASTSWTLGALIGAQSLKASAANPRPDWPGQPGIWGEVLINAIGLQPYSARFGEPLGSLGARPDFVGGLAPTVEVCRVAGGACVQTVATLTALELAEAALYRAAWPSYPALTGGATYRFRVLLNGAEIGHADATASESGRLFNQAPGTTILIRFVIESS